MRLVRFRVLVCSLLALTLASEHLARAQIVAGRVTATRDGAAVPGAIVALLDSAGGVVLTSFAEENGAFRLTAPTPGRFSIRVDRVGFRSSTTNSFLLAQGDSVTIPITISSEAVSLRAVRVNADRRCLVRPQEGLAVAQLWAEARKALSATELTQLAQAAARRRHDPHVFTVRTRSFKRDLEPQALKSVHEEQFEREGEAVTPFVSRDVDSLDRSGYMSGTMEAGSTYYAPDAAILLSDKFLDSHCFRVYAGPQGDRDELIGLAFEPEYLTSDWARRTRRVDVAGVLWLNRATAELRYMDYHYVNLPVDVPNEAAGGQLEFRPLPDGRWIVWRWYVRAPQMEQRQTVTQPSGYARAESHLELRMIHEEGAEILEVMPPGSHRAKLAALRGFIHDSIRGGPLVGARVFLSGTSFAAISGEDGSYVIESIPPGIYTVSVLASRLDSLLLDPPAREITLGAGQTEHVDFAVPPVRTLASRLCPDIAASDSLSILVGVIRDTSEAAAPGASVRAEWNEFSKPTSNTLAMRPLITETKAAAGGRFALCGLPPNTRVMVQARRGRITAVEPTVHFRPGEVRRLDLRLRAP